MTDGEWPDELVLHLHLKGVESFSVSNGKTVLHAAVSSQGGQTTRQWKEHDESAPLDAKSPLWMVIRWIGDDKTHEDGCFQIHLPQALMAGEPKSITLNWIDFYRN